MQIKDLLVALIGCVGLVNAAAISKEAGLSADLAAVTPLDVPSQAGVVSEGEAMEAKKKVKTKKIRDPDTTTTVTTTITSTGTSSFPTTTSSFTTTYVTTYTSVIGSSSGAGRGFTAGAVTVGAAALSLVWALL